LLLSRAGKPRVLILTENAARVSSESYHAGTSHSRAMREEQAGRAEARRANRANVANRANLAEGFLVTHDSLDQAANAIETG
jgi:hypothetical protein